MTGPDPSPTLARAESSPVAPERFRDTPLVCGYLGPDRAGLWPGLTSAAPVPVVVRSTGPYHGFAASDAPGLEPVPGHQNGPTAWCWGRYVSERRPPSGWQDAAQELGLAGFWANPDAVRVHADALGFQGVYFRELAGTTYFSNRVHPLAVLGDGPLHPDWRAWGHQLYVCSFPGSATAFTEVSRLVFGQSVRLQGGTVTLDRSIPEWLLTGRDDGTPEEVLEALRASVPAEVAREPSVLTLSGGWDSRMLALLLTRYGGRPQTWSTHKDTGGVEDVEYAASVAAALGLDNHVVPTDGPGYWARHREPSLLRFEHEVSLHTWFTPLAARVRRLGLLVWDGIAGDILIRFANGSVIVDAGDRAAQRHAQWTTWSRTGVPAVNYYGVRPDLAQLWWQEGYAEYLRGGAIFDGLPSELALRAITHKTNRQIAAAPLRLFAPDVPVGLPFISAPSMRVLSRLATERLADGAFYRDLLHRLSPEVAGLPSTNDGLRRIPRTTRPGQDHRRVFSSMATEIAADPTVLSLFTPEAQAALREGAPRGVVSREVLQWAQNLASWRRRYAGWLTDDLP